MLRPANGRRKPENGLHLCAAISFTSLLLLLSLFVLHSRLSSSPTAGISLPLPSEINSSASADPLLEDAPDNDALEGGGDDDDRIDVADDVEEDDLILSAEEDDEGDADDDTSGGHFWDHVIGVRRMGFGGGKGFPDGGGGGEEAKIAKIAKIVFSSDDSAVNAAVNEDVMLGKRGSSGGGGGPSWAKWYEEKGRFLRQDGMFSGSLELLNPMNHPMLQDPDGPGLGGLTRGDKLVRKAMLKELENEKVPFRGGNGGSSRVVEGRSLSSEKELGGGIAKVGLRKEHVYPDGENWGYYPGVEPRLGFSVFMDKFFGGNQCGGGGGVRVFMVWNSPSWSFGVRHQRGLESLLHHHKDACVVVFSEMMELDFFDDFVKDGFKIAVVMPNLDELLNDTPVNIFASMWNDWRKTRYYSIHYSELIRLAALYKYGGIYLDSDVIVLNPLASVQNTIIMENKTSGNPIFNGAVMAFEKNSHFIMECMMEFYSTYDDTSLTWNGAELLNRVFKKLSSEKNQTDANLKLNIEDSHIFFPIDSQNITRYFTAAVDEYEKKQQDILFREILDGSKTFHFWNSITSALVPEPGSLVERLINHHCLYCLDVL